PGAEVVPDRGVHRDHPGEVFIRYEAGHVVDILIGEVGGDLDEYGNVAGRGVVRGLLHCVHDRSQRGDRLQVPQPWRVRRGDVDDEVVGERGETLGRVFVIRDRLRRGCDSRL